MDALEAEKQATLSYYEEKIQKLQKQNEAIEDQIRLEQLQENLAKARAKKQLVYKDGKFQYIADVDAVSAAENELAEFNRGKALSTEVANLESLKDRAVSSIEEQIKYWERYKDEWGSVVSEYQRSQNKLIAEQILGTKLEGENWEKRLGDLSEYVAQYRSLVSQLDSVQSPTITNDRGFDPDIDYSLAIQDAVKHGATQQDVDRLLTERQNKINAVYGGKDPNPHWADNLWHYAGGTTDARTGLAVVGEHGAELRVLNHGDGVIPAEQTKNLWEWGAMRPAEFVSAVSPMAQQGKNLMPVTIQNLNLPNVKDGNDFVNYLKNNLFNQTLQFAHA